MDVTGFSATLEHMMNDDMHDDRREGVRVRLPEGIGCLLRREGGGRAALVELNDVSPSGAGASLPWGADQSIEFELLDALRDGHPVELVGGRKQISRVGQVVWAQNDEGVSWRFGFRFDQPLEEFAGRLRTLMMQEHPASPGRTAVSID
jgi:hypothetical protein